MQKTIQRFSTRALDYAAHRPGYPAELVRFLERAGLPSGGVVADVGSGTGNLAEVFLARRHRVYAVEPNPAMRRAAESRLGGNTRFVSVAGQAEATTLPDACVDWVVAGQAFHWFALEPARAEFLRILKKGGGLAVMWNKRERATGSFGEVYQGLVDRFKRESAPVSHANVTPGMLLAFFAPAEPMWASVAHEQILDREGVKGRLLSSSYMPEAGSETARAMESALGEVFDRCQVHGKVSLQYTAAMCYGRLVPRGN